MAMLANVMRNPRSQELLKTGEGSGSQHLGAQGVRLQLSEIELSGSINSNEKSPSIVRYVRRYAL